jgi:hypothetical protein
MLCDGNTGLEVERVEAEVLLPEKMEYTQLRRLDIESDECHV